MTEQKINASARKKPRKKSGQVNAAVVGVRRAFASWIRGLASSMLTSESIAFDEHREATENWGHDQVIFGDKMLYLWTSFSGLLPTKELFGRTTPFVAPNYLALRVLRRIWWDYQLWIKDSHWNAEEYFHSPSFRDARVARLELILWNRDRTKTSRASKNCYVCVNC